MRRDVSGAHVQRSRREHQRPAVARDQRPQITRPGARTDSAGVRRAPAASRRTRFIDAASRGGQTMLVKIVPNDKANPPGKLADAELHFTEGALEGLKLIGFSIWERRGGTGGRNVTFPARQYSVNGERRSFALLRPVADIHTQERVRDLILEAF